MKTKIRRTEIWKRRSLIFLMMMPVLSLSVSAQKSSYSGGFPFFRSFLDDEMMGLLLPANSNDNKPNAAIKHGLTNEGLMMTDGKDEVGAFFLSDNPFPTIDGFLIEFEYIMKRKEIGTEHTDGMCMFLVDAKQMNILKFASSGACFGYTHKYGNETKYQVKGIEGGYLAVALDQRPFKENRMDSWETRSGIEYKSNENLDKVILKDDYKTRSNVTIRGAAGNRKLTYKFDNSPSLTLPISQWGYPLLITRHTGMEEDRPTGLENQVGYKLNPLTGGLIKEVDPPIRKPFNVSGGDFFDGPDDPAYRKIIIALEPDTDDGEGYKISVSIQHGKDTTLVIKDYSDPAEVTYFENGFSGIWDAKFGQHYIAYNSPFITYTVSTPEELIFGFAASTGIFTSFTNIIRNLRITPLNAANTANDDIRNHRRGPVTVRPLDNDIGYRDMGDKVISSSEFLDPTSFRFWSDEKHCLEGIHEYNDDDGKWTYDSKTKQVVFFPKKGFKGVASTMYDVNGSYYPYDQPHFRSSIAIINVTIDDNQP
ncbi:MAG: hypothetical protein LUH22_19230 [Bacteroides sp.]|nr:hypothetical protein [Bacteroides sp.]